MLTPTDPEAELVFYLVERAGEPSDETSEIEEITDKIDDWDEVLRLAEFHSLTPQLYFSLRNTEGVIPERIQRVVRTRHCENAIKNLQYSRSLHTVYDYLRKGGVRVLPYKGPVLAEAVWGNLTARSFGDLDLLVAKEDVLTARELLLQRGYEQLNYSDVPAERLVEGTVFRWGKEFRFIHERDEIPVELRFDFAGRNRPHSSLFEDLWNRRTSVELAGRTIPALSPADRAMLLLAHGTKHSWQRLSWVCDIVQLLKRDIGWNQLLTRATRYGWRNAVLFGLAVVAELTETKLPRPISCELRKYHRWGAYVLSALLRENLTEGSLPIPLEPVTTVLFLNDDLRGSLTELVHILVSPQKLDFECVSLPPELYPLYYLVRPCRIGRTLAERVAAKWSRTG